MQSTRTRPGTGRVSHWLTRIPAWLAAITLFCLMVMTFFDVLLRSLFNNPIEAATELTRLFMAIIVFACLPLITWKGEHIIVDLLDRFFTGWAERLREAVINITSGILLFWPVWRLQVLAERARSNGDTTEYLQIPQFYIAWFITAITAITALLLIVRGLLYLFKPALVSKHPSKPAVD